MSECYWLIDNRDGNNDNFIPRDLISCLSFIIFFLGFLIDLMAQSNYLCFVHDWRVARCYTLLKNLK